MSHRPTIAVLVLVLALAAAACGGGADATSVSSADDQSSGQAADGTPDGASGPVIIATPNILADLTSRLVGDAATVVALMPTGADPHSFQLSSAQGQTLRDADLVVANGLGLEEGMLDALEAAAEDGVEVVSLAETVEPLAGSDDADGRDDDHADDDHADEDHADEEHADEEHADEEHADEEHADEEHADENESEEGHVHEHDHADGDPHFWLDPERVAEAMADLAHHIAEVDDTLTAEEWAARADDLATELDALDDELEEILSVVPEDRRVLVTNHDSYDYFADAYDFEVLGTVIPGGATLAEPSAADLEALVEAIRDAGVPAIFAETTDPSRLAEVVAEEVGREVAVVELYGGSLSDADGPVATYADYMRHNATLIADALG